jgi:hypothetical protein
VVRDKNSSYSINNKKPTQWILLRLHQKDRFIWHKSFHLLNMETQNKICHVITRRSE